MTTKPFRTAAVLGAGVMGSQIAAHLANAGLQVLLLDVTPQAIGKEGKPNDIVAGAFKAATKMNPEPFFSPAIQKRVSLGNFDEDFERISEADWVIEVVVERLDIKQSVMARIEEHGYTILESVLSTELVDALVSDLSRLETELRIGPSANSFEGAKTVRIYNLLARGKLYQRIPVHEEVLPIVEGVLDSGCLVSSLSSIGIDPGEIAQPVHADDQLIPVPKPHVALVCNSMWALTDFTDANGATRIVPGSHRADHSPDYLSEIDTIAAEMPKGSVMVYDGSLWHGGGANRSRSRRVGIAMNYCAVIGYGGR